MTTLVNKINFPEFSSLRCLMMPYRQGDPDSVPDEFAPYFPIIESTFIQQDDIGFLTIDESPVLAGNPHRAAHAKFERALHTEAGILKGEAIWGGGYWGGRINVKLDSDVQVLLANNLDKSCAIWNSEHFDTTSDGDIGHLADEYPYSRATLMDAGDLHKIGIFTPHESLPVKHDFNRQFLRIISSGVHGRELHFTINPKFQN